MAAQSLLTHVSPVQEPTSDPPAHFALFDTSPLSFSYRNKFNFSFPTKPLLCFTIPTTWPYSLNVFCNAAYLYLHNDQSQAYNNIIIHHRQFAIAIYYNCQTKSLHYCTPIAPQFSYPFYPSIYSLTYAFLILIASHRIYLLSDLPILLSMLSIIATIFRTPLIFNAVFSMPTSRIFFALHSLSDNRGQCLSIA